MDDMGYITTSDGRISVRRDEFLGHSVFEAPLGDCIILYTKAQPRGKCVNYKSKEELLSAGREITKQLALHPVKEV